MNSEKTHIFADVVVFAVLSSFLCTAFPFHIARLWKGTFFLLKSEFCISESEHSGAYFRSLFFSSFTYFFPLLSFRQSASFMQRHGEQSCIPIERYHQHDDVCVHVGSPVTLERRIYPPLLSVIWLWISQAWFLSDNDDLSLQLMMSTNQTGKYFVSVIKHLNLSSISCIPNQGSITMDRLNVSTVAVTDTPFLDRITIKITFPTIWKDLLLIHIEKIPLGGGKVLHQLHTISMPTLHSSYCMPFQSF